MLQHRSCISGCEATHLLTLPIEIEMQKACEQNRTVVYEHPSPPSLPLHQQESEVLLYAGGGSQHCRFILIEAEQALFLSTAGSRARTTLWNHKGVELLQRRVQQPAVQEDEHLLPHNTQSITCSFAHASRQQISNLCVAQCSRKSVVFCL